MPILLPIPKLAASPVSPLQTAPRFRSDLLQSGKTWPQDVGYLRDVYMEIFSIWEKVQPFTYETDAEGTKTVSESKYDPAQDEAVYGKIEPLLRELVLGLEGVSRQMTSRRDVFRTVENSRHDFETASSHAKAGDHALALMYFSYALMKLHRLLDGLTREANKMKLGYGYDTRGEVHEQGGTSGDDRHLWDTSNSPKKDRTPMNPANCMVDSEAENDYPSLREFKHKRVYWPPRTR